MPTSMKIGFGVRACLAPPKINWIAAKRNSNTRTLSNLTKIALGFIPVVNPWWLPYEIYWIKFLMLTNGTSRPDLPSKKRQCSSPTNTLVNTVPYTEFWSSTSPLTRRWRRRSLGIVSGTLNERFHKVKEWARPNRCSPSMVRNYHLANKLFRHTPYQQNAGVVGLAVNIVLDWWS